MREWKDGMMNPGQLTQIIRCSVAWGGCHTSRPSVPRSMRHGRRSQEVRVGSCQSRMEGWDVQDFEDRRSLETRTRRRGDSMEGVWSTE